MIYVVKRSGKQEPFDPEKVRTSVLNSARDAGVQLSFKEARLISDDVERQLTAVSGGNGIISSFEVGSLVRTALGEFGYSNVADFFERGRTEDSSDISRHLEAIQEHTDALEKLIKADSENKEDPDSIGTLRDEKRNRTKLYRGMNEEP